VLYLRREHREGLGPDEFLALGLVALSYGGALAVQAYGFLSVFAAGLALRRVEMLETPRRPNSTVEPVLPGETKETIATDAAKAPGYMAQTVLSFNEQLDHIGEVAVVLLVGGMLAIYGLPSGAVLLICLLLLVIRPIAVFLGLVGSDTDHLERGLISWFGIRGIGSIYYMSNAVEHGLPADLAEPLVAITLTTVAVSVFAHGLSATPVISRYFRRPRTSLRS
jgi:NhaP-type Na+/H+ or K+/H+ antiporter